jgi:hypothetical protein
VFSVVRISVFGLNPWRSRLAVSGPPSMLATQHDPAAFISKWRHIELKERSASQEHFLDLCRLATYSQFLQYREALENPPPVWHVDHRLRQGSI